LVDEGSQYDDLEWERFFKCVLEQPHRPFVLTAADFQQLQPVALGRQGQQEATQGGLCEQFTKCNEKVLLRAVYRTNDVEHLGFLNRIRWKQPTREQLLEYFGDRHLRCHLRRAVALGMSLSLEQGHPFIWLCHNNAGASEVCEAALEEVGITPEELENGYCCDPTSKSRLRIVAKPGVLVRLTRNEDKSRGFVNGAVGMVVTVLAGNAVFTVRLLESGNMVLVCPMEEDGQRFLPCCYGYATTIRRVQGATLHLGCIYFDQRYHHAGRGYGYVAVSRFKTRAGVYLWGKLRRTDFLPVGPEKEDEVLERGYYSLDSDAEDGAGMEHAYDDRDNGLGGPADEGLPFAVSSDFV
jgi:hypothetical protein